jgi:predicted transcriptional regulator
MTCPLPADQSKGRKSKQKVLPLPGKAQLALANRQWYRWVLPFNTKSEAVMAAARPVAIKIDEDTKSRVKRLADARQRTPHWLMREAISQYVDREEKREAFRQDSLQAWAAFRATGQHVTADQADVWLAQLEQGNDVDPPACRS